MVRSKTGTAAIASVAALASLFVGNLDAQILKGSTASVNRMYSHASEHGFDFFRTGAEVRKAADAGQLVRIFESAHVELHDVSYPYVKSEVNLFVTRLGEQYHQKCGQRLVVTGATRPTNMKLANASDLSVHPTGMAIDLRRPDPGECRTWLRSVLSSLESAGVIEATEELRPPHFHVAVYPRQYSGYVAALTGVTTQAETRAALNAEASPEAQLKAYSVRNGDSLWLIAQRHDTTVQAIKDANKLRGAMIHPGQVIMIPTSNTGK